MRAKYKRIVAKGIGARLLVYGLACLTIAAAQAASVSVKSTGGAYQALTLKPIKSFKGYHRGTFSPDGKLIALQSEHYFDVVEAATGKKAYRITPPGSVLIETAFSPDGRYIACSYIETGGKRRVEDVVARVDLWDVPTGKLSVRLNVTTSGPSSIGTLSFTGVVGQGEYLLATNAGGVVQVFKFGAGRLGSGQPRMFASPREA